MNSQRTGIMLRSALTLVLVITLVLSVACWGSPTFRIVFENQTEYDLTIYVNNYKMGSVSPGGQIMSTGIPWDLGKYHIEAKNIENEITFSETLTRAQMQRIESLVWKVVIPPLQKGIENSDNVTAK